MVFTTVAYYENLNTAGNFTNILPVPDDSVTVVGNSILVPRLTPMLGGAYGAGLDIAFARATSPSLEAFNLVDIVPVDQVTGQPQEPLRMMQFFDNPIPLVVDESLRFQGLETNAGASQVNGVYWLMDKLEPLPTVNGKKLPIRTIRYAPNITLEPGKWTDVSLSAGILQTLKAGRYAFVGMLAQSTNGIAARVKFVGEGVDHRPGTPVIDGGFPAAPLFRMGRLGVWGEFEHNQIPIIQMLATAADTSQQIFLDLIKIR